MHEKTGHGESAEMYLKSIAELMRDEAPVPISALAARLEITVVSATEMIHRMEDEGLVVHQPYKGVKLTDRGSDSAISILRRQRLWECFLLDRLGLPWDRVYDFACQLEHAVGPEVTEALADYLDHPQTCPHGNPIPASDGTWVETPALPLTDLLPGEQAVIQRVDPIGAGSLSYLSEHGLKPGANLTLEAIEPIDGLRRLQTAQGPAVLGSRISGQVYVRRDQTSQAGEAQAGN